MAGEPAAVTIGILAVQGDFAAHAAVLQRLGCAHRLVRGPGDLAGVDAIILPGGESTTMLKLLAPGGFMERLREFVGGHAALGTCAGAILLAGQVTGPAQASLGAIEMTAVRNAYGRQIDSSIKQARVRPEFVAALGAEELESVLIRAPRFERLGPGVDVIAEAEGQPVLVQQGKIVAASFHPELSSQEQVHRWFLERVRSALKSG